MKRINGVLMSAILALFILRPLTAGAVTCPTLSAYGKGVLVGEHLFGGAPSPGTILIRRGYVTEYDSERGVPRWAAWHAVPEYLDTPKREGRWKSFRTDPDLDDPVRNGDYDGLKAAFDYARGHIVPYFMAGGDRDDDGQDAEIEAVNNLPIEDIDDPCTVFEINYMSNVAPQLHGAFNGAGGLWFALETVVRTQLVGTGTSLHITAGTIFGDADIHKVGPEEDIHVPHMFYKILITESGVVPFLFIHKAQIGDKGCGLDAVLETCIVKLADIEALTGLDFFAGLSDADEALLEGTDGTAVWDVLLAH